MNIETILNIVVASAARQQTELKEHCEKFIQELKQDGLITAAGQVEKLIKTIMDDTAGYAGYWTLLGENRTPDEVTGGGKYMHQKQRDFLINECGLEKHHTFLDIGTGSLRGTRLLIPYLDKGCFYGMDITAELVEYSKQRVATDPELTDKEPTLICDDRFRFSKIFPGVVFDVAFAKSVFTHIYPDGVWDCLVQLRKVIADDGSFYATIFKDNSAGTYKGDVQIMYYNTEWLAETAEMAGWKLTEIGQTRVGQYMCLFEPVIASAQAQQDLRLMTA